MRQPGRSKAKTKTSVLLSVLGVGLVLVALYAIVVAFGGGGGGGKRARINSYFVNGTRATVLATLAGQHMPKGDLERAALLAAQVKSRGEGGEESRLLCTTFTTATAENLALAFANMRQLGAACDWAVVFYRPPVDALLVHVFRGNVTRLFGFAKRLVMLEAATERHALLARFPSVPQSLARLSTSASFSSSHNDQYEDAMPFNSLVYPKPLLYLHLLPLLPRYSRVWLLDDDVSLADVDAKHLGHLWDCAFWPDLPPLVVQPLVSPSNAGYAYLGVQGWAEQTQGGGRVLAASTGFIELQAPLMDARFFEWFLRFVVVPMLRPLHVLGADWGFDDLFCTAAANYDLATRAQQKRGPDDRGRNVTCAVLVDGSSIRHLDRRALDASVGKGVKWYLNHEMLGLVVRAFPTFFHKGFRSARASPFNSTFHRRALGVISDQCPRMRQTVLS